MPLSGKHSIKKDLNMLGHNADKESDSHAPDQVYWLYETIFGDDGFGIKHVLFLNSKRFTSNGPIAAKCCLAEDLELMSR